MSNQDRLKIVNRTITDLAMVIGCDSSPNLIRIEKMRDLLAERDRLEQDQ